MEELVERRLAAVVAAAEAYVEAGERRATPDTTAWWGEVDGKYDRLVCAVHALWGTREPIPLPIGQILRLLPGPNLGPEPDPRTRHGRGEPPPGGGQRPPGGSTDD